MKRVLMIFTGGTITMAPGAGQGIQPVLSGEDLVKAVPQLGGLAQLHVCSLMARPSPSLTPEDLLGIAERIEEPGARFDASVVVQGTDTIEETAFTLDLLTDSRRPVVVTGAMRAPTDPGADGPANLLAAVRLACAEAARGLGTLVVLNDEVHAARFVQKGHTTLPSAFVSPGAGPVGQMVEGRFRSLVRLTALPRLDRPSSVADCTVALLRVSTGDDGRLLPALSGLGYHGAVIEALGAGHVPSGMVDRIRRLATEMPVVLATRVMAGSVFTRTYGYPGSEIDLLAAGLMPAGFLSATKAHLLLRLLLANGLRDEDLSREFAARTLMS